MLEGEPASGRSGRHAGKDPRENSMDEHEGKSDTHGGKKTQFFENRKTAEHQDGKGADAGQHCQQTDGPDFSGSFLSICHCRTIQEEQIGNAMIDCDGDDGAAKSQRHNGN